MRRVLFGWLALGAAAVISTACDKTNPDDFDAGPEAGIATFDASPGDATSDASDAEAAADALADGILGNDGGRCGASTYTTAPGGGACDPEHFVFAAGRGGGNHCFAPPAGTFCDVLQVSVFSLDASSLPPGFSCGSAELGVTTCVYALHDGGANGTLDDAAINAACAVTVALPQSTVSCIIYD
jgi:hypothetical protein